MLSPSRESHAASHGLRLLWLFSLLTAFFFNINQLPLFDLDEGAFSEATREMFQRGDFLSTYLNGVPRYDKPILSYWLQALSVSLFGMNEFAFRLPSALAASLWSLLILAFTSRIATPREGYIAAIFMAGAAGVGIIGKAATADALLNLFLAGSLLSLYLYLTQEQLRFLITAAVFAGLGFLTKGPVALLLPAVVSLLFCLWSGRLRLWLAMAFHPAAWLTFLAIGAPWYILQYLREGPGFIDNFIGTHNLGRYSSAMEGHSGPWWFYLPVILLVVFPFGPQLLRPLGEIRRLAAGDLGRFMLVWFLFVVLFFSFSATKLPHYILYGMTPLFILGGLHLRERPGLVSVYLSLLLLILLMLVLPALIGRLLPTINDPTIAAALTDRQALFPLDYYLVLLLLGGACLYLFTGAGRSRLGRLLIAGPVSSFLVSGFLLPLAAEIQQQPIKEAGLIAAKYDRPAVMWHLNTPSFSVYSNRIVPTRKPRAGELVLTRSRYLPRLDGYELLFSARGISLALVTPEALPHDATLPPGLGPSAPADGGGAHDPPGGPEPGSLPAAQPGSLPAAPSKDVGDDHPPG